MTQYSRFSFRVPDHYSAILGLVTRYDGRVVASTHAPADYDEFFAIHVDDQIEVLVMSAARSDAERLVSDFVTLFEDSGLPYVGVTSIAPEGLVCKSGAMASGAAYINQVGYPEARELRGIEGAFNPDEAIKVTLRRTGISSTGLQMIFGIPEATTGYGRSPGL